MAHTEEPQSSDPSGEHEAPLGDHVYDGIQEYDNPLPRWWTAIFWATFVFSIGYFFHYHLSGNGQSVAQGYAVDRRAADETRAREALTQNVTEDLLASLLTNSAAVDKGKETFIGKCAVCHGQKGEGLIGPNLTDAHFIHGSGKMMDLYDVTSNGVDAKGMPAWSKQLGPDELRSVVAFVGTLRHTNLPGKAPEGAEHPPSQ